MTTSPQISFVVPVYNTEKYLADCIHSILTQEGNYDFEIIMVDDCSTDNSETIARSFTDRRIRYIRHATNQGADITINRGFYESQGKYIARIDSDDIYKADFLKKTMPILENNSDIGLAYGRAEHIDEKNQIIGRSPAKGQDTFGEHLETLLFKNIIYAPTVIGRREAWFHALPIPYGMHFNDWYLSLRMAEKWHFYYLDEVLAQYRLHAQGMHQVMLKSKNQRWERFTFWILHSTLANPYRYEEKQKIKNKALARHYFACADRYFSGTDSMTDARRCYLQAVKHNFFLLFNAGLLRRTLATFIDRKIYNSLKKIISTKKIQS